MKQRGTENYDSWTKHLVYHHDNIMILFYNDKIYYNNSIYNNNYNYFIVIIIIFIIPPWSSLTAQRINSTGMHLHWCNTRPNTVCAHCPIRQAWKLTWRKTQHSTCTLSNSTGMKTNVTQDPTQYVHALHYTVYTEDARPNTVRAHSPLHSVHWRQHMHSYKSVCSTKVYVLIFTWSRKRINITV